jgi:hypothetical protein
VDLDLVVAAEALVASRAVVLALAGALVVSLAVGPAEALVVGWAVQLGSSRPSPEQGILVVWAFFFYLAMIIG